MQDVKSFLFQDQVNHLCTTAIQTVALDCRIKLNKVAIQVLRDAGAKRFVYISTSYEVSKMLKGPIPGCIYGKRYAAHVAYSMFECENDKSSFMYGRKRFPRLREVYLSLVESVFAKAYLGGNGALRKLSTMKLRIGVKFRNFDFCKGLFSLKFKILIV